MKTFALPDLGEGLQEAEIVSWHVAVGDRVVVDQPLVSVETAKAVVEVPSPWCGKIVALHAKAGDVVKVGGAIVDIDADGAMQDSGTVVGKLPEPEPKSADVHFVKPSGAVQVRASPAVRNLARELGIDLSTIEGSGPDGLITREDIETKAKAPLDEGLFVPLRGVRRAMAEAMKSAILVVPATISDEAVIEDWPAGTDPTIRLIRAIVAGCRAAPALNAWLDAKRSSRALHERVDLGIAIETEDGLFVPVLRDVGARSEADLRASLDLMKRGVMIRSFPLSELRGQTITLSNFGMLGGLSAALTIVPPQVAILGAGRIHTAVRSVEAKMKIVRVLPLSLTFDHRAVTGAEAIRFLNAAIASLKEA